MRILRSLSIAVCLSNFTAYAALAGFWHTQGLIFSKKQRTITEAKNTLDSYISAPPNPQNMLDIFAGEWASKFPVQYGLTAGLNPLFEDSRIHWMINELNGILGMRVVELGPLEGAHSYLLDRAGAASVLAIESNQRAFLKCLIVKELLGMPSVEFVMGDFRQYFDRTPARFDLCIASGVLYHMKEPVALLAQIAAQCDRLFLWTHYYDKKVIDRDKNLKHRFQDTVKRVTNGFGYSMHRYAYLEGLKNAGFCGGNAEFAYWISRADLLGALRHFGFRNIVVHDEQAEHIHGPSLNLLATK
jgi:hypothetical protein